MDEHEGGAAPQDSGELVEMGPGPREEELSSAQANELEAFEHMNGGGVDAHGLPNGEGHPHDHGAVGEEHELLPGDEEETGLVDSNGIPLTVASIDAAACKTPDCPWAPDEDNEMVRLVEDDEYRKDKVGDTGFIIFPPVASYLSRTVRCVRGRYADLRGLEAQAHLDAATAAAAAVAAAHHHQHHSLPMVGHMGPVPSEMLAGLYSMDPTGQGGGFPGISPEFASAIAQIQGHPPSQEQLASYQHLIQAHPVGQYYGAEGVAAGMQADPNAYTQLDASMLQMAAGAYTLPPAPAEMAAAAAGGDGATTTQPTHDRHFWKPEQQHELLRLVSEPSYRQQLLGITEVNWDLIAKHLGRGKRSVQRKFDNLKGTLIPGQPAGNTPLPSNDGKKWTQEEVQDLVRLVEDQAFLKEKLGLDKLDWRALGQHFMRSYESVSYKYSYVKNTGRTGMEGKTKHAKAKHETSYKEMAIWALQQLHAQTGVPEGTSGQICQIIATNPSYVPQLDTAIVSGKKTLQRWKHGVRSALNAFDMFQKTGAVRDQEVVWRLDEGKVQAEQQALQEKASRQRAKPLSGAQRRKLKKAAAAESTADEAGEEGAHEALAIMAGGAVAAAGAANGAASSAGGSERAPSARLAAKRKIDEVNGVAGEEQEEGASPDGYNGGTGGEGGEGEHDAKRLQLDQEAAAAVAAMEALTPEQQAELQMQMQGMQQMAGGEAMTHEQLAQLQLQLGQLPQLIMPHASSGSMDAATAAQMQQLAALAPEEQQAFLAQVMVGQPPMDAMQQLAAAGLDLSAMPPLTLEQQQSMMASLMQPAGQLTAEQLHAALGMPHAGEYHLHGLMHHQEEGMPEQHPGEQHGGGMGEHGQEGVPHQDQQQQHEHDAAMQHQMHQHMLEQHALHEQALQQQQQEALQQHEHALQQQQEALQAHDLEHEGLHDVAPLRKPMPRMRM